MVLSDYACFEYITDGFIGYIPAYRRLYCKMRALVPRQLFNF